MKIFRNILSPIRCLTAEQMNCRTMNSASKIQRHLGYLLENTKVATEDLNIKGRYWLKTHNNSYLAALQIYRKNGQILGFEILSPAVKAHGSPFELAYQREYILTYKKPELFWTSPNYSNLGSQLKHFLEQSLRRNTVRGLVNFQHFTGERYLNKEVFLYSPAIEDKLNELMKFLPRNA